MLTITGRKMYAVTTGIRTAIRMGYLEQYTTVNAKAIVNIIAMTQTHNN